MRDSIDNLAPATLYEISKLDGEAKELVYESIGTSDFIGVAAVRMLASEANQEVFTKLFSWVKDHPTKAITPKTIRTLQAEQTVETRQPDSVYRQIVEEANARQPTMAERMAAAELAEVKEALAKPARDRMELLETKTREYSDLITKTNRAVDDLRLFLRAIDPAMAPSCWLNCVVTPPDSA